LTIGRSRPTTQLRKELPAVYPLLDELVRRVGFDAFYIDQSHVASYGAYVSTAHRLPYLFRSHNVEHEIWRRHTDRETNPMMKRWLQSQCRKWERYEVEQMSRADLCAAITDRDAETIRRLLPDTPVVTIPAAVDLDRFVHHPVEKREPATLLLLGGMNWAPNRDAAIWFTTEILPLIKYECPDVRVRLVGESPPLDELPPPSETLLIEGYVDDIVPFYRNATVGLIPLRVGGGMRVKMVEMMASGLPIVATPIGAEGNDATAGVHYLEAATPQGFAAEVVGMLRSAERRQAFSEAGRRLVEEHYSIDQIGRCYEGAIEQARENHRAATRSVRSERMMPS
jgi:glycosyltransferase involved in cell wall biosynthesis